MYLETYNEVKKFFGGLLRYAMPVGIVYNLKLFYVCFSLNQFHAMRKITLLLSLFCLVQSLSAQFVTIPDANFRAELIRLYPSCFNANQQMDTTCSAVVSERVWTCPFNRLQI